MKEISRGELHLYPAAREELETNLDRFYAALVPAEKKQAKRLIIPEKKEQFILGRGFLRSLLAAYTGFKPGELALSSDENGKPFLVNSRIEFNLSHSHEQYLVGVTCSTPLGVDVQQLYQLTNPEFLTKKYFSPGEIDTLPERTDEGYLEAFFTCWVRKEAYLKGLGFGLRKNPSRITLIASTTGTSQPLSEQPLPRDPGGWKILDIDSPPGYKAAAAVRFPDPRVQVITLPEVFNILDPFIDS
ncbi:MAG: 4'-phosphopantetheinyl transferase superfamily protein [Anaerolineales bacterium]|nr:4'-phosphopantetheinyl transferase superfamily protein [Anaerolineales bacterium]